MNAIDTNVLIYARDPRDSRKQQIASGLIQSLNDVVLLWQVACEYVAASRKLKGQNDLQAWDDIARLAMVWPLKPPSAQVFVKARQLSTAHSLSVWDALLIAACAEPDVSALYTEDLQHGESIAGVKMVNPFA